MLKAKVLAMCVCPAVVAPPTILAVHAPARHAVARVLHRAAHRLDRAEPGPAAIPAPALAALPCAPSLAAGGGALPIVGGDLIGGEGDAGLTVADAGGIAYPGIGGGYGGGYGGGGYYGGGGGGGGGGGRTPVPPGGASGPSGGLPAGPVVPPAGPAAPASGAPEPAAWVFLVIGFGLVGAIARGRSGVVGATDRTATEQAPAA